MGWVGLVAHEIALLDLGMNWDWTCDSGLSIGEFLGSTLCPVYHLQEVVVNSTFRCFKDIFLLGNRFHFHWAFYICFIGA